MSKIDVKYIFKEDYNPIYTTGAFGGINPTGEIVINFYLERAAIPREQQEELVVVSGKILKVIDQKEQEKINSKFVRVIENGVILSLSSAVDLHNWLGNQINVLKDLTESKLKNEN